MKRYSFFLALAILVVSFGLANAGSITVDDIVGSYVHPDGNTYIVPGAPVTFQLRYDNTTGTAAGGMTNGYVVYTLGGGSFDPVSGNSLPVLVWTANFDLVWAEGALDASTVRFGGSKLTGGGLPAGFNEVSFEVHTGGIAEGESVCIDSTWYPPTGVWKWVNNEGAPSWGGPYCIEAVTPPCIAPHITNLPTSLTFSHCDPISFNFTAEFDPNDVSGAIEFLSASVGNVSPGGSWTYGAMVGDAGTMTVDIEVGNGTCSRIESFTLNVTNEAPVINCPAGTLSRTTGTSTIQMTATDDCDEATFSWSIVSYSGTGTATIDPNTGLVTIEEGTAGNYDVVVGLSDGEAYVECTINVEIVAGSAYQVVIDCIGEPSGPVYQGQTVDVDVTLTTAQEAIGGYDLLIAYDNSALSFQSATMGSAYDWEYFTYRYGANGNCSNACPSGLVRVVAVAETNNGANHPTYFGTGVLFTMKFLVTNDRTFECSNIPLRFFWMDCGDNTFSNKEGTVLLLSDAVYDGYDPETANNYQDIFDPTYGWPTYFGAQEECDFTGKGDAERGVSFQSGCVFIACADEIDARGDINLNNVSNEVADAVLYSRYFVYGLGVLNINTEGQIAASDVNADGIALSVADLVYLIRVVIGDALPYPKLAPTTTVVSNTDGVLNVRDAMGAAVVTISGNVTPELLVDNMEMIYNYDATTNSTRALVYNMTDANATFSGNFINANGNVESIELSTYEGSTVSAKILPGNYQLAQNYPNPFNPTTMIAWSMPTAGDVTLTIYNITGQKVAEHAGTYEAGNHSFEWDASAQASGIYFYKLNTGNFEQTKKMVLLK